MPEQWYQQALTPPTVLECNIRIGVIPSQDHLQVLAEIKDPTNGVLVGQWSRPHSTMVGLDAALDAACERVRRWLDEAVEPF